MMWTLFITAEGWAAPLRIDGYTSKEWAEEAGADAATRFPACHWWVTKLPTKSEPWRRLWAKPAQERK